MLLIPKASSHDTGKAHNHGTRLLGINADQRGNGIESIEKKVRIDLTGERIETGLNEQVFLLFELHLVASVVPYLERNGDAKTGRGVSGEAEGNGIVRVCDCEQSSIKSGA